jgi:hypothetical protein
MGYGKTSNKKTCLTFIQTRTRYVAICISLTHSERIEISLLLGTQLNENLGAFGSKHINKGGA